MRMYNREYLNDLLEVTIQGNGARTTPSVH